VAQVLIRNLDEGTVDRLKQRALRNQRSLQAELQIIIERAATVGNADGAAVAAKIRRKLGNRSIPTAPC
jgi:plasmid stability protein